MWESIRRVGQSYLTGRRGKYPASVCFCTLAVHAPYRRRARLLCADAPSVPWVVVTDEPDDFAGLPVRASVAEHLETCGSWRMPAFVELARHLAGDEGVMRSARWCHEALITVTKDGREDRFFEAWAGAADFLQARGVYTGEGGIIGLAALAARVRHEGGGPKGE